MFYKHGHIRSPEFFSNYVKCPEKRDAEILWCFVEFFFHNSSYYLATYCLQSSDFLNKKFQFLIQKCQQFSEQIYPKASSNKRNTLSLIVWGEFIRQGLTRCSCEFNPAKMNGTHIAMPFCWLNINMRQKQKDQMN